MLAQLSLSLLMVFPVLVMLPFIINGFGKIIWDQTLQSVLFMSSCVFMKHELAAGGNLRASLAYLLGPCLVAGYMIGQHGFRGHVLRFK